MPPSGAIVRAGVNDTPKAPTAPATTMGVYNDASSRTTATYSNKDRTDAANCSRVITLPPFFPLR